MDFFLEIIIGGIVANFFGLYTRYFFFKLIGRKKTIKYLSGEIKDEQTSASQKFFNVITGMASFSLLVIGIVYLLGIFL